MKQLSKADKYSQMTNKYKNISKENVIALSKSRSDLQGWRNKLTENSSIFSPNILLDMGGGNGQQLIRFKSIYKNFFIGWMVDFAEKPIEIIDFLKTNKFKYIKQDAFKFIESENLPKFDMIYMFGFLHEIRDVERLMIKLKKIIKNECNIIISDNDLYRSPEQLGKILNKINKNFTTYSSKSYFNLLHIFTKISGDGKKKIYSFHRGRVDKVFAICCTILKKEQFINLI